MDYAHDVLVSTDWVFENLENPNLRLVEVSEDILLYDVGHVPGAVKLDWHTELQRKDIRDFITAADFAKLMEAKGIGNDTLVILYGDKSNWWAAYAFWFLKYNGHENVKLMDGGRQKWVAEDKPLEESGPTDVALEAKSYRVPYRNESIRAYAHDVMPHLLEVQRDRAALVDVRSPAEYTGERLHMPEYPQEGAQRGGHIPGAHNIPWSQAVNEDGTFKSSQELKDLYASKNVTDDRPTIVYCRIAERSSHTWFVLAYLLGYDNVRNYDGSWTEWGNLIGVPIVQGDTPS